MSKNKRKRERAERRANRSGTTREVEQSVKDVIRDEAIELTTEGAQIDPVALQRAYWGDNPYHFRGDVLYCGDRMVCTIEAFPAIVEMRKTNKRLSELRGREVRREALVLQPLKKELA